MSRVPEVESALRFCSVRARPFKTGQLVKTGYDWSAENRPPCVKYHGGDIHTPTKEICAKVRSP
jgi:hypothetical protein